MLYPTLDAKTDFILCSSMQRIKCISVVRNKHTYLLVCTTRMKNFNSIKEADTVYCGYVVI